MTDQERIERLERIVEFLAAQMFPTQTLDELMNNDPKRHFKSYVREDNGPLGNQTRVTK